ncbi:MAG: acyl-CoA reductase [Myxococcota bacterium]
MKLRALQDLERGAGRALLDATVAIGFSEPVARAGLNAELETWTDDAFSLVRSELPDDLKPARRPQTVLIIAASTLPASTLRAVLMARLLGARVLLKPASGQAAIADAIALADPDVQVRAFASTDLESLDRAIADADSVVALGGDRTIQELRARVPFAKGFAGYGHRLSVAWLSRFDEADAVKLARDLCAWDQAGCLSPQVAWVEGDLDAASERLAEALREVERALPMTLPPEAASMRHAMRAFADMSGHAHITETALVAALPIPSFRPSPGFRALWMLPADDASIRSIASMISTIGTDAPARCEFMPAGIRRCELGDMQRPPLTWQHDGRPNLLPMLRPY